MKKYYLFYQDQDEWVLWGIGSSSDDYQEVRKGFDEAGTAYQFVFGEVIDQGGNLNKNTEDNYIEDEDDELETWNTEIEDDEEFEESYYSTEQEESPY
jgi:hypothetical protein